MIVVYFSETSLEKEWTDMQKKHEHVQFAEINKHFFDGQHMTVFVHFGKKELEAKHKARFRFLHIFKNYKMANGIAVFGPTYPKGILGTTFNEYILKHYKEFKNADFVTIREDDTQGKLMNPCKTCGIFLESLHL